LNDVIFLEWRLSFAMYNNDDDDGEILPVLSQRSDRWGECNCRSFSVGTVVSLYTHSEFPKIAGNYIWPVDWHQHEMVAQITSHQLEIALIP
jgi:hypothetical protein